MKRSSLAKLAAICALWISGTASAQAQRPWEVSFGVASYNTYYEEDFMSKIRDNEVSSYPQDLRGNSFSLLTLQPSITYRFRRQLRLPFFATVEGQLPVITLKGLETGHKYKPDNAYLVQQEDIEHKSYAFRGMFGWEMIPWLQPYILFDYAVFTSRRMNQLSGTDSGTLIAEKDNDYSETVTSTHLGFGIAGYFSPMENNPLRVRYQLGYEAPKMSSVVNDLDQFGSIPTGQNTTGYTIGGKLQVDLPLGLSLHDDYVSIGAFARKLYWNGDGELSKGLGQWPANYTVEAGGFVSVGMFF